MTVMSEGLLLNSKYIEMGREEEGFQAFLTQPPLVIVCHVSTNFALISFVVRGYPNHFDSGDRHLQLGRRK